MKLMAVFVCVLVISSGLALDSCLHVRGHDLFDDDHSMRLHVVVAVALVVTVVVDLLALRRDNVISALIHQQKQHSAEEQSPLELHLRKKEREREKKKRK